VVQALRTAPPPLVDAEATIPTPEPNTLAPFPEVHEAPTTVASPLTDLDDVFQDMDSSVELLRVPDIQVMERALSMVSSFPKSSTNANPVDPTTNPYSVSNTQLKDILSTPSTYEEA
jgi:hypothetical protein